MGATINHIVLFAFILASLLVAGDAVDPCSYSGTVTVGDNWYTLGVCSFTFSKAHVSFFVASTNKMTSLIVAGDDCRSITSNPKIYSTACKDKSSSNYKCEESDIEVNTSPVCLRLGCNAAIGSCAVTVQFKAVDSVTGIAFIDEYLNYLVGGGVALVVLVLVILYCMCRSPSRAPVAPVSQPMVVMAAPPPPYMQQPPQQHQGVMNAVHIHAPPLSVTPNLAMTTMALLMMIAVVAGQDSLIKQCYGIINEPCCGVESKQEYSSCRTMMKYVMYCGQYKTCTAGCLTTPEWAAAGLSEAQRLGYSSVADVAIALWKQCTQRYDQLSCYGRHSTANSQNGRYTRTALLDQDPSVEWDNYLVPSKEFYDTVTSNCNVSSDNSTIIIIAACCSAVGLLLIVGIVIYMYRRRRKTLATDAV